MPELPTGAITFLFSDIEGSTRLLEGLGDGYVALLREHNRIFREVISEHEGAEVSTEGDSFFVVFRSPLNAIDAATRIQRRLTDWPFPAPVRVRIGLHTGLGQLAGGDYVGIDVHRGARIAAAGHGGQILVSEATRALVESRLPANLSLLDLGPGRLKDLTHPVRLYQLMDLPELRATTLEAHATYFADFAQQQWEELTGPRRELALNDGGRHSESPRILAPLDCRERSCPAQ